ncbi:hypothetical protein K0M31_014049 [Melipona bicolor]|uniref:Uncharacterized protein n=1 Tax=Melipona bicolor TaxID=60889 RepID=A0AA40G7S4_9HYME|nr:hypothetical protein K0M31_014049 [Melipona bicolor]
MKPRNTKTRIPHISRPFPVSVVQEIFRLGAVGNNQNACTGTKVFREESVEWPAFPRSHPNNSGNRVRRIGRQAMTRMAGVSVSATSPGASNDGLTKQQLELIQQIMQQTQQQQQQQQQQTSAQQPQQQRNNSSTTVTAQIQKTQKPSVKSTTSSGNVSNNSGNSSATNNARSSPKPKVWSHVQNARDKEIYLDHCLMAAQHCEQSSTSQSAYITRTRKHFNETADGVVCSNDIFCHCD